MRSAHGALLPTLVFSLVLAEILSERFDLPRPRLAGLSLYAVGTTLAPAIWLRARAGPAASSVGAPDSLPGEPPPA